MSERFWVKLDRNRFYREIFGCETDAKRIAFVNEFATHLFFGKGSSAFAAEILSEAEESHEKQHEAAKTAANARWGDAKRIPKSNTKGNARTEQNRTVTEEKKTEHKDKPQLGVWFGDERFVLAWKAWSGERKKKPGAMQYADLENLAKGDIEAAIAILNQSAVKQWTGLFELKGAKSNEHRTQKTGREFEESLRL